MSERDVQAEWERNGVQTAPTNFGNFASERHCLYVGWLVGRARRADIRMEPIADEHGDWTDRCIVTLAGNTMYPPLIAEFIIPEPPEDWSPE